MIMILFRQNIEDSQVRYVGIQEEDSGYCQSQSDGMSFSEELKIEAFKNPGILNPSRYHFNSSISDRRRGEQAQPMERWVQEPLFSFPKEIFG